MTLEVAVALGVEGVRIGTWTSPSRVSGCTVLLPPEGSLGAVAVRGAAPGTREAAALGAFGKVEVCHGVVLSGGSAFGLATADGVTRWLEERGVGYPVARARVPIVGGAIVLDAGVAERDERPDAAAGYAACDAALDSDPAEGTVGVGTGCTVAKVAGLGHGWRGGQGIAVLEAAGVRVGAIVANNAVGEVIDDDGTWLARARVGDEVARYPLVDLPPPPTAEPADGVADQPPPQPGGPTRGPGPAGPTANTVIGCVVTDAPLSKLEAHRVADLAHAGISRAVRPAHTRSDGDALFCLATHTATPEVDPPGDLVAHLAAEAVALATRRGPLAATGAHGLPGLADGS